MYFLLSFLFLLFILIITFLLIPISSTIKIEGGRVKIFVFKLKLIDQELKIMLDEQHIEKTKKYGKAYIKLLKKINYKLLDLNVEGMNYQYSVSPLYYGFSHAFLANLKGYLNTINVPFEYNLAYQGASYFEFTGIVELHLGRLLLEVIKIKGGKYERTSNKQIT